ncbi:hypothetical protein AGMMS49546_05880 [Spirochaetia bacterium]|nr:hypothetical protein AGMMS49546_05880 [Spirochaetia bacterium]
MRLSISGKNSDSGPDPTALAATRTYKYFFYNLNIRYVQWSLGFIDILYKKMIEYKHGKLVR